MARFEVFIPAADEHSFNVTFRVESANWMAALKTGLQKLGEQGPAAQNVLVDVQDDNSVHVTEPTSGRVFQIRELTEEEASAARVKVPREAAPEPVPLQKKVGAATVPGAPAFVFDPSARSSAKTLPETPSPFAEEKPERTVRTQAPEPETLEQPRHPVAEAPEERRLDPALVVATVTEGRPSHTPLGGVGLPVTAEATPLRQQEAPSERGASPTVPIAHHHAQQVVELESPVRPIRGRIGRQKSTSAEREALEDVLAEVFERVDQVNREPDLGKALYFLLDLALEKIPAESGSVLKADGATGDLSFLAARGPRAQELLKAKIVVPHHQGIAGFCAMEGVCVALSDVQKDPRYYPVVSERLKYETRSVLTAPMMTHGRAFGCFQVLNKKDDKPFSAHELGLLSYIAHHGALYMNART